MAKRVTVAAMLTAVCMALSFLESQLILPFAPGVKLGLANAVVLLMFVNNFVKEGIYVNLSRILLSSFLFAGLFSLVFSLPAAIISGAAVLTLKRFKCFSCVGLSIIGASLHNLTQIFVSVFVYDTWAVLSYAPILCVAGAVTGFLTGTVVFFLESKLKKIF